MKIQNNSINRTAHYIPQWVVVAGVLLCSVANADLTALDATELEDVTGAAGISMVVHSDKTTFDLVYEDTGDKLSTSKLVISDMGGDYTTAPIKFDMVALGDANDTRALQVTLPSKIVSSGINLGTAALSVDDTYSASGDSLTGTGFADAPVRTQYQAVVTASNYRFGNDGSGNPSTTAKVGNNNDIFNTNIGVNEVQLQIQDVGKNYSGNLSGSGRLQVDDWHKIGYNIGEAEINAATARREAYAVTDKNNLGLENGLTAGQDGVATLDSGGYAFIQGWKDARAMDTGNGIMEKGNGGFGSSLSGDAQKAVSGHMQSCNESGGSCSDQSSTFSAGDSGKGIVKYNINLTSRINTTDTDKVFYNKGETGNNRYTGTNINTHVADSNQYTGAGGCYMGGTSLIPSGQMHCEARPIAEGLSWYTNNKDYKPVSVSEYQSIETNAKGSQLAHDPRVIFSVGKQTEVRLQALLKRCSRWCTHDIDDSNTPTKNPRAAHRQANLNPAVVLLDAKGNVIAANSSSGGDLKDINSVNGTSINQNASDDNEYMTMGVIEATLGDPYYGKAQDRVLSTIRISAPPEQAAPITQAHGNLASDISVNLGGNIQVFGH